MRVAVTGASGHLGANLVRALVDDGHDVSALVREDVRALQGLPARRVRGDLREPASLRRAFEGTEIVFHAAGLIALDDDRNGALQQVNAAGTRAVVEACLESGVRRLVHVSSIHALSSHPADQPTDESRAAADEDPDALPYDRSKARGEREVLAGLARGLDAVILNPTAVIGPHDWKPSRMGRAIVSLARGRMPAVVDGGFDFVGAGDVARGAIAAAHSGRRGERYVLSGSWRTVAALAGEVARVTGRRAPRIVVPAAWARLGASASETLVRLTGATPLFTRQAIDILGTHRHVRRDKAERELGYAPRPFEETVDTTLAWFRAREAW